jgi:hypothetical protein
MAVGNPQAELGCVVLDGRKRCALGKRGGRPRRHGKLSNRSLSCAAGAILKYHVNIAGFIERDAADFVLRGDSDLHAVERERCSRCRGRQGTPIEALVGAYSKAAVVTCQVGRTVSAQGPRAQECAACQVVHVDLLIHLIAYKEDAIGDGDIADRVGGRQRLA